jgi:hypothetical protein
MLARRKEEKRAAQEAELERLTSIYEKRDESMLRDSGQESFE